MPLKSWWDTAAIRREWEKELQIEAEALTMEEVLQDKTLREQIMPGNAFTQGSPLLDAQFHYQRNTLSKVLLVLEQAEQVGLQTEGPQSVRLKASEDHIRTATRRLATGWLGSEHRDAEYRAAALLLNFSRTNGIEVWPPATKKQLDAANARAGGELGKVAKAFRKDTFESDPHFQGYEDHSLGENRAQLVVEFNFPLQTLTEYAKKADWPKFFDLCHVLTRPSDSLTFQYAASRSLGMFCQELGIDLMGVSRQSARQI